MHKLIFIFMMAGVSAALGQGFETGLISQTGYFNLVPDVNDILTEQKNDAYFESNELIKMRLFLSKSSSYTPPLVGRIDFYNNMIEVDVAGKFFGVDIKDIYRVEVYKSKGDGIDTINFINAKPVLGAKKMYLLEIVVDSEMSLLKRRKVRYKRANYNKALDVGDREDKHIPKTVFYSFKKGELIEIPLNKEKKLVEVLSGLFPAEKLSVVPENEYDLIQLFKIKNKKK